MWHGTTKERADSIVLQSFDTRLCRPPHLWGRGTYFSTRPDYTHHYAKPDEDNNRYLFLARVLVGRHTVGRADHMRPPPIRSANRPAQEATAAPPPSPSPADPSSSSSTSAQPTGQATTSTDPATASNGPDKKSDEEVENSCSGFYTSCTDDSSPPSIFVIFENYHVSSVFEI